jgi:thiamine pyrophosphokinase
MIDRMGEDRSESEGPRVEWPGAGAGRRRRAAVVALEGATAADLKRALRAAAPFDRKPLLVAVDGGLSTCRAAGRRPDLFVGDRDSSRRVPRALPSTIYPVDKDYSDFSGALVELLRLGAEIVVVAGLLGGRLDHEWANVQEVGEAAGDFVGFLAPSDRGLVVVTARSVTARTRARRLVSVFALRRRATVSLRGTRWTLKRRRLEPGSLGLSNLTGTALSLEVHAGVVALVFPKMRAS